MNRLGFIFCALVAGCTLTPQEHCESHYQPHTAILITPPLNREQLILLTQERGEEKYVALAFGENRSEAWFKLDNDSVLLCRYEDVSDA